MDCNRFENNKDADGISTYLVASLNKANDNEEVTETLHKLNVMHEKSIKNADLLGEKKERMNNTGIVTSFQDRQTFQLDEGTSLLFHEAKDSYASEFVQPIQLSNGTTAYVYHSGVPTLNIDADDADDQGSDSNNNTIIISATLPTVAQETEIESQPMQSFKCDHANCKKKYSTAHHLKVHKRTHTGEKPFVCKWKNCTKVFTTSYALKSHVRVHTGEKPYPCPQSSCNKAFKTSGDLQKHIRTHTGVKPFKCPFEGCGKAFTTSNICKVHIRTHTGERPYKCPYPACVKSFSNITNYKNHVRIHTGEKPYVCLVDNCGKQFTEYSSLYKHQIVHSVVKPYSCDNCGKTFRQTSSLIIHKRRVHKDMSKSNGDNVQYEEATDHQHSSHTSMEEKEKQSSEVPSTSSENFSTVVVLPADTITPSCVVVNSQHSPQLIIPNDEDGAQRFQPLIVSQEGCTVPTTDCGENSTSTNNTTTLPKPNLDVQRPEKVEDGQLYIDGGTLCTSELEVSLLGNTAHNSTLWLNCSDPTNNPQVEKDNSDQYSYATLEIDGTNYLVQIVGDPNAPADGVNAAIVSEPISDPGTTNNFKDTSTSLTAVVKQRADKEEMRTCKVVLDENQLSGIATNVPSITQDSTSIFNTLPLYASTTSSTSNEDAALVPEKDDHHIILPTFHSTTCQKSEYRKILPESDKSKAGHITVVFPNSNQRISALNRTRFILPKDVL
ncbi:unnamed protein product [Clavelina lepadiformis]|uniref:C2H2-type domain-containing protein n=1 Tax=Clavelina lepadiformis TaxID=159417 RepID=A0ABP0H4C4_CLALP